MFQPPMDPPLDPPPFAAQPLNVFPQQANPIPVPLHPPYPEMITLAITELNEKDGSSKRAIAKHIEAHFQNLPATHADLLTQHIQLLKSSGQLVMVKNSYKLSVPGSVPPTPVVASNGAVDASPGDPSSGGTKKRRGRPPKVITPDTLQAAVPVFGAPVDMNSEPIVAPQATPVPIPVQQAQDVGVELVDGTAVVPAVATPRGRGRPPKQLVGTPKQTSGSEKRGRGRPKGSGGKPVVSGVAKSGSVSGKGRGRPKKSVTFVAGQDGVPFAVPAAAPVKKAGRPRGRPATNTSLIVAPVAVTSVAPGAGGVAPVLGKRRGRPPKAFQPGEAKKPKLQKPKLQKPMHLRLSRAGRPVGRPKKNASNAATSSKDAQMAAAYLDLKTKHDNLQGRVLRAVNVIRPCLVDVGALAALADIEQLATQLVGNPQLQPPPQAHAEPEPAPPQAQQQLEPANAL